MSVFDVEVLEGRDDGFGGVHLAISGPHSEFRIELTAEETDELVNKLVAVHGQQAIQNGGRGG